MEEFYTKVMADKCFKFPIETLDGLKVDICMDICQDEIHLIIDKDGQCLQNDERTGYDGFVELIERLKLLKFNRIAGIFETEPTDYFEKYYTSKNIVLDIQDCSVCLEPTRTKTKCKHYLCWRCYDELTSNKCPLCRGCLDYECDCDDCDDE